MKLAVCSAIAATQLALVEADASGELFRGPTKGQEYGDWLKGLESWRDGQVAATDNVCSRSPDDLECVYLNPHVNWTRTSYVQPQTHLYDRFLYDPSKHKYTVDKYLNYTNNLYGGIDSILIWPTYTNIGIDDRNQWDYFRTLPGGLDGVKDLTAQFHDKGVRVLWAYNPWDAGTRDEGESHWITMARLLKQTKGDGFNGDTMPYIQREFWDAGIQNDYPFVGEPELGGYGNTEAVSSSNWDPIGWGYFMGGSLDSVTQVYWPEPGVDMLKWLDPRGRRMTNICDRWAKQRWEAIQLALFNGVGYESWENVWGVYMHFNERDAEALRRVATLLRWLGKREYIQNYKRWEPFTPALLGVTPESSSKVTLTEGTTVQALGHSWGLGRGFNCYQGAGATDLEHPQGSSHGQGSLQWCQGSCLNTPNCTGITVSKVSEKVFECYRRADIVTDLCQWPSQWEDTYLLDKPPAFPKAASGVYASRFDHFNNVDCVWTIINKGDQDATALLDVSTCPAFETTSRIFDMWSGAELSTQGSSSNVRISIEAQGYLVVMVAGPKTANSKDLKELLGTMEPLFQTGGLASFSNAWAPLKQTMKEANSALKFEKAPSGMVEIPLAKGFHFVAGGVEIEGGCDASNDPVGVCCSIKCAKFAGAPEECQCSFWGEDSRGVDVQFPWEDHPRRIHDQKMDVGPFYLDRDLVTNADYAKFLLNSTYKPTDSSFFLRHWGNHSPSQLPEALEKRPVVYVSLADARAFCSWKKKRLPHAYEWQLAAQGADGRTYPWGSKDDHGNTPVVTRGRTVPPLPPVGSFSPHGDSPFGIRDMVGLVWQYTDEFQDDHTRSVLLKGSSLYNPILSTAFPAAGQVGNWYFPPAREVNKHNKMILMDDSYERASTLGFRCAADHVKGQPGPYHFKAATTTGIPTFV
jgi:formylglycine-generating enzyme required for sulfatase activity